MSSYRRGAVLGLTVAETFILLTFLLLVALLGLTYPDEPFPEPTSPSGPQVWEPPDEIETLVNALEEARRAQEEAERARAAAEREREQARKAMVEAEQARTDAEHERDQAHERAEQARRAVEEAKQARTDVERERDKAHEKAEQARRAVEEAEQARTDAEREHEQARNDLEVLRRKGKNPPCWYQVVDAGEGKTREKPDYAFNVAIHEYSIELAPRTPPPGGAFDDGGGLYADEWKRLQLDELPYGKRLSDTEFIDAVSELVAKGRNREVRTYECVFSVMVWDKTPDHAKRRWKDAHDRIIEGSFSAYTVQDLVWKGYESWAQPGPGTVEPRPE